MPKRRQTRAGVRPRSGGQRPRGNPASRSGSAADARPALAVPLTPGASGTRQAVERSSARLLFFLAHLPRWVPMVVALGLLITGFVVPGLFGAAALLLVAIFLGWLCYLSWPRINTSGRAMRVLAMACMAVLVVWQARR
ncbi:MAG TPA: DUF6703 family protein [Streptosporangiaceae bacterium]|nr:DUF6703 family protein [Streptosporangiaceae bacterium]